MKKKDLQSNKFQITINNPVQHGYTHDTISQTLVSKFKTLLYFCMADEQGKQYHTHIFVCFSSRVRFSTLKKQFPHAHIEAVKGTVSSNIQYIKKNGKWKNTTKGETSISGTFFEWGNPPADSKGKRYDMTELYRMVDEGLSNAAILDVNQDYIPYIDTINKLRTTLLIDKYKSHRRLELKVSYYFGATRTGKTRYVLDKYGDENVYRITDYQHPFDNYDCQKVIVFEEFRSSLTLSDMLSYCDIYPIELPARYSNKYACFEKVIIISNWTLDMQYANLQTSDWETWQAFLRRIHEVKEFKSDNVQISHGDALSYINNPKFVSVPANVHIPFITDKQKKRSV